MKSLLATSLIPLLFAVPSSACTDSLSRFQDFENRVVDAGVDPDFDAEVIEVIPDVTGTFLLGLGAVIAPDPPFQFIADIDLEQDEDGATVDLELTALHRFDRVPIGDPLVAKNVPVDETGKFEAAFEGIVPGDANPVTGSELTIDVTVIGRIRSKDMFCGEANGMILRPVMLDIAGSTIGAIRIEAGMEGEQLPPPLADCPVGE